MTVANKFMVKECIYCCWRGAVVVASLTGNRMRGVLTARVSAAVLAQQAQPPAKGC